MYSLGESITAVTVRTIIEQSKHWSVLQFVRYPFMYSKIPLPKETKQYAHLIIIQP